MQTKPIIVYGDGTSALYTLHELVKRGETVVWSLGSGKRLHPILPTLTEVDAMGPVQKAWTSLGHLGLDFVSGSFHRVFRNKSFQPPKLGFEEQLWAPEKEMIRPTETVLKSSDEAIETPSLIQVEHELREFLLSHPQIQFLDYASLIECDFSETGGMAQFAVADHSQSKFEFSRFIYTDSLKNLKSFPKLQAAVKRQMGSIKAGTMASALQVVFTHSIGLPQSLQMGLSIPMNRESGEKFDRQVLGYFPTPIQSVWTVFLQSSEIEDNHEIMKKMRKMKQTLQRTFEGFDFVGSIQKEQVHFEDHVLAIDGQLELPVSKDLAWLMTDSIGTSRSLKRVADCFELKV